MEKPLCQMSKAEKIADLKNRSRIKEEYYSRYLSALLSDDIALSTKIEKFAFQYSHKTVEALKHYRVAEIAFNEFGFTSYEYNEFTDELEFPFNDFTTVLVTPKEIYHADAWKSCVYMAQGVNGKWAYGISASCPMYERSYPITVLLGSYKTKTLALCSGLEEIKKIYRFIKANLPIDLNATDAEMIIANADRILSGQYLPFKTQSPRSESSTSIR